MNRTNETKIAKMKKNMDKKPEMWKKDRGRRLNKTKGTKEAGTKGTKETKGTRRKSQKTQIFFFSIQLA